MRRLPQPGHGAARLLRDAVLIERRVHIGGVTLDVAGPGFVAPHLDGFGPFLDPAPGDHRIGLRIDALGTAAPPPGSSLVYTRPGLRFAEGPAGLWAAIDDTRGSVEAAIQLALEAALLFAGGLVIHASAGIVAGRAWLLPGRSGAGKSTAARAAGFDAVLCDEMCVVRCVDGAVQVSGTPFWSEGRSLPLQTGHAPLGVLARLVQAPAVGVEPLSTAEAAAFLLSCVTLYRHAAAARAAAFETACTIAEAARCVTLRFPKEGPWLTAALAGVSGASSPRP